MLNTFFRPAAVLALALAAAIVTSAAEQQTPAPASQAIRLYVFDGGILESDPGRYQLTKADVGTTQLSIASYLVVHPKGLLMWDTGAVSDAEWTPGAQPVVHRLKLDDGQDRQVTLRSSLLSQLKAIGRSPGDMTYLAVSHGHWDHTGNANLFARSTWLARRAERDAMFVPKPTGSVRAATYAALKNSRTVILEKSEHDVFGDGTVILKEAPGHTPGHQVLFVRLARTGPVLLSGDLYHYEAERRLDRVPTFEFSVDQTRTARRDVDGFLEKHRAQLWIQHNLAAHQKLKKSPDYYD